jgi:hypothetical protein
VIALAPHFDRGIPVSWFDREGAQAFGGVAVDANDPPTFESEAEFLRRHKLLTPSEERWLLDHPEALEPEPLMFEDEP